MIPLWKRLLTLASYRCNWTPEEAETLQQAIFLLKAWDEDDEEPAMHGGPPNVEILTKRGWVKMLGPRA